jgi:hypothetical protein
LQSIFQSGSSQAAADFWAQLTEESYSTDMPCAKPALQGPDRYLYDYFGVSVWIASQPWSLAGTGLRGLMNRFASGHVVKVAEKLGAAPVSSAKAGSYRDKEIAYRHD